MPLALLKEGEHERVGRLGSEQGRGEEEEREH